jgi:arylformamidase
LSPTILDISPPLHEGIAVWPGDVPFRRTSSLRMEDGANLTLGDMHTTFHAGAHTDAPCHYARGGAGIGERPLDLYMGPCQVIAVDVPRGERVLPAHLGVAVRAPRVLLRTGSFPDPDVFNQDFNSLSPELVDHLAAAGVRLVGIDTPSIDPFADKVLQSHNAVARHDMAVLEGIVLGHVAPGLYELVALPLRIPGADASPVRAVLLER